MHKPIVFIALTLFFASAPSLAHHSFAMFDHAKLSTLSGAIEEFEYINPHSWIHLAVPDNLGGTVTWSFEMTGIGFLERDGWSRDTIAPGDRVEIGFHPLKDGSNGGQFRSIVLPDGRSLCQGGIGPTSCADKPQF